MCVSLNKATHGDIFNAVALAIRHFQQDHFLLSLTRQREERKKRVYYLSMEFLLGQSLRNNLLNMNLLAEMRQVVNDMGFDLDHLLDEEPDAALGNGGLGRLAACFIDSMATLDIAASGHGIKYEYGLFRQPFQNDQQIEHPDDWHSMHSPWLVEHHAQQILIPPGAILNTAKILMAIIIQCGWAGKRLSVYPMTISFPVTGIRRPTSCGFIARWPLTPLISIFSIAVIISRR